MNQQYLFQVAYYDYLVGDSWPDMKKYNDQFIKNVSYEKTNNKIPFTNHSFRMQTTYPGMVIGLSHPHYSGRDKKNQEIKCGFTLDYVTGMPYWPGSSVKGVIRHAFEIKVNDCFLIQGMLSDMGIHIDDSKYQKLVQEIFGSEPGKKGENKKGADVFLDALIVEANEHNKVLGFDYITSHKLSKEDRIGLDEPNPVRILKILPNVTILFRFQLKDSEICKDLTARKKKELYKQLLIRLGVGGKTNLGYGSLKSVEHSKGNIDYELSPKFNSVNNYKRGR